MRRQRFWLRVTAGGHSPVLVEGALDAANSRLLVGCEGHFLRLQQLRAPEEEVVKGCVKGGVQGGVQGSVQGGVQGSSRRRVRDGV